MSSYQESKDLTPFKSFDIALAEPRPTSALILLGSTSMISLHKEINDGREIL